MHLRSHKGKKIHPRAREFLKVGSKLENGKMNESVNIRLNISARLQLKIVSLRQGAEGLCKSHNKIHSSQY